MNIKRFKKFITVFLLSMLLLSFVLPNVCVDIISVVAATVKVDGLEAKGAIKSKVKVETTTTFSRMGDTIRAPHGQAMQGAEFHEELWDKYSVIAAEDGGANGSGGGANDKLAEQIGNSGNYDSNGGVFGGGGGVMPNSSGGGITEDALRKAKEAIEAKRAAEIAKKIASERQQEYLRESIIESAAAIQRKLQQDLAKQTLSIQETAFPTQQDYGSPIFTPDVNRIVMPEISIIVPTVAQTVMPYVPQTQQTISPSAPSFENPTVASRRQGMVINKESLSATVEVNEIQMPKETVPESIMPINPDEIISNTLINATNTFVEMPTVAPPETIAESQAPEVEYHDVPKVETQATEPQTEIVTRTPYDDIESSIRESESIAETAIQETTVQETTIVETAASMSGGENSEEEPDKKGDDSSEEEQKEPDEDNNIHLAKPEEFKGKKVFEIETIGNIGLSAEYLSILSTKTIVLLISIICLLIGSVIYILSQRDKRSKRNYF